MSETARHRPTCPFCGAGWSEAMLGQYDRMSSARDCACCAGPHFEQGHGEPLADLPATDLCCETCGRAIYRAPGSVF